MRERGVAVPFQVRFPLLPIWEKGARGMGAYPLTNRNALLSSASVSGVLGVSSQMR